MFVTVDIEIADRVLPSICSIGIITWENGQIIDDFFSLVNPDCEVEEFFKDRHGLTDIELQNAPTLPELWIDIYDRLDHKTVFFYNANQALRTIIERAAIEQLNLPHMNYGSVKSICKRTWKGLENYSLPAITEKFNITNIHNNAHEDSISIGKLIYMAAEHLELTNPYDLFKKIGFAGGYIRNNKKIPYRAVKSKDKQFYITKEWTNK